MNAVLIQHIMSSFTINQNPCEHGSYFSNMFRFKIVKIVMLFSRLFNFCDMTFQLLNILLFLPFYSFFLQF